MLIVQMEKKGLGFFLILKILIFLEEIKKVSENYLWETSPCPEYTDTILPSIFSWKITKWNTRMVTHGWLQEKYTVFLLQCEALGP